MSTSKSDEGSREPFFDRIRRRLVLRWQAKQDYDRARGTVHLRMLEEARGRLREQLKLAIKAHRDAQQAYDRELQAVDRELTNALVRHLVYTELDRVPGIGPTLKSKIICYVFHGRLSDLHQAHRLQGIGDQRQQDISRWVRHIEAQIPYRIKGNFPGKSQVIVAHQNRLDRYRDRLDATERRSSRLERLETPLDAALADLKAVTWHDFYEALFENAGPSEKVQQYILGVFAAWEPMPDWFHQVLSIEEA